MPSDMELVNDPRYRPSCWRGAMSPIYAMAIGKIMAEEMPCRNRMKTRTGTESAMIYPNDRSEKRASPADIRARRPRLSERRPKRGMKTAREKAKDENIRPSHRPVAPRSTAYRGRRGMTIPIPIMVVKTAPYRDEKIRYLTSSERGLSGNGRSVSS